MKITFYDRIKNELLNDDIEPKHSISLISRTFINTELINRIKWIMAKAKSINELEQLLVKLKKLIIQAPRSADQNQLEADPAEFAQFLVEIKKEQEFYNPIKWIEAELEYINYLKRKTIFVTQAATVKYETKEWLDQGEVMQIFKISRSTLNRRVAEGMPAQKMGGRQMFNRAKINDWLNQLDHVTQY